jgi:hypothetical protein
MVTLALVLPFLLASELPLRDRLPALGLFFLFLVSIASYAFAFLYSVFMGAENGDGPRGAPGWPHPRLALRCGVIGFACFLAGPAGLAAIGLYFWIHCGDPAFLDWLIFTELGVVAVSYWLLCVLAVSRRDRLLDANPARVLELFDWLGQPVLVGAALASVLVLSHAYSAVAAVRELHRNPGAGALLLAVCSFSGLFWGTCIFRLLGVWCHLARGRVKLAQAQTSTV